MARPERNSVDYFPFICEEGTKMFYIEQTYGNDGFATFVKLLRELAKTDFHYLNLSDSRTLMYLSAKCRVPVERLELIISDLADLGKFHKQLWHENKVVWCQDFIDNISDAYIKRKNKCIDFSGLLLLLDSLGIRKLSNDTLNGVENPHSIVYYRKEEDIIEDLGKKKSKNEIFGLEMLAAPMWCETICMQNKILPPDLKNWIDEFNKKLITELVEKSNKQDYASHFARWLPGELKKAGTGAKTGTNKFHENRG